VELYRPTGVVDSMNIKDIQEEIYQLWYLFNMERAISTSVHICSELVSIGVTATSERRRETI